MSTFHSHEQPIISRFRSDELPNSFFGNLGVFELPPGSIVGFDASGPVRDNDSKGLAVVSQPMLTIYNGYCRSYEEVPLPPDTALLRLSPVTASGLSELEKRWQDRDYGVLHGEDTQAVAARKALGNISILQLLEGGEPDPEIVKSVDFTVGVSESTIDLLIAVTRRMAQQTNEI